MAGKQITITVAEHTFEQLQRLADKKNIKKSAIVTLALDQFAKAEEKAEKGVTNENGK